MPKGRRSNQQRSNRAYAARRHRGNQAGTLRSRSHIRRTVLLDDAATRAGVLDETATFLDKLRARFRRRSK